jgi:hypothetical protein
VWMKCLTRQAIHIWRNIEALACNRCCSAKALIITYSVCVFVDIVIQHVIERASYCHLCPARLYNNFPHYLINGTIFKKTEVTEPKMGFFIFSKTFAWNISHSKNNWARYQKYILIFIKEPVILVRF